MEDKQTFTNHLQSEVEHRGKKPGKGLFSSARILHVPHLQNGCEPNLWIPASTSQHPQYLWSASSSCIYIANIIYISWVIPMLWKSLITSLGGCNNLQRGQTEKSVWRQVPGCALLGTCSSHPLGIHVLFNEYCNIQHPKPHSDFSVQSRLIPLTSVNLFW